MLQTRSTHWGKATDQKPGFDQAAWYHCDHLGTPLEMTDEQGKIVWSARYEAFGKASVKMKEKYRNPIRFQGQYEDEETGLHYNYHRYYDPRLGRYLSKDSIGLAGGVNLMGYVGGSPVIYVDRLCLYQMFHRSLQVSLPYARHCFSRFTDGSTLSFDPDGVHPDTDPNKEKTICTKPQDSNKDDCIKQEMKKCAGNYHFTKFNCCHCVEQALKACDTSIPASSWPNWPINPGPQPGETGYSTVPEYNSNLGL